MLNPPVYLDGYGTVELGVGADGVTPIIRYSVDFPGALNVGRLTGSGRVDKYSNFQTGNFLVYPGDTNSEGWLLVTLQGRYDIGYVDGFFEISGPALHGIGSFERR